MYTRNIPGELVIFTDKNQPMWLGAIGKFKRMMDSYGVYELVKNSPIGDWKIGEEFCFFPREVELYHKKESPTYKKCLEILSKNEI